MSGKNQLDIDIPLICCTHYDSDHVQTVVFSGPGNDPASVPIGEIRRCTQCLCQKFEDTRSQVEISELDLEVAA